VGVALVAAVEESAGEVEEVDGMAMYFLGLSRGLRLDMFDGDGGRKRRNHGVLASFDFCVLCSFFVSDFLFVADSVAVFSVAVLLHVPGGKLTSQTVTTQIEPSARHMYKASCNTAGRGGSSKSPIFVASERPMRGGWL